ncbi:MAG: hypothetical protein LBP51_03905 [Deferribacteraceae bacterium]|jgi:hypothetical protein|nr:hypothetical protein [Deferribacteraceae bacterium]
MQKIVESYLAIYPLVKAAEVEEGSFYKNVLDEIRGEFQTYNITGGEKAKLLISFISSAYSEITTIAHKSALELARLSCTLPLEEALSAGQGEKAEAESKLILKRLENLREQEVTTALTGIFRALSELLGNMAQGGISAPPEFVEVCSSFISASMKHINSLKPDIFATD